MSFDRRNFFRPSPPAFTPRDEDAWMLLPPQYRTVFEQEGNTERLCGRLEALFRDETCEKDSLVIRKLVFACMGLKPLTSEDLAVINSAAHRD